MTSGALKIKEIYKPYDVWRGCGRIPPGKGENKAGWFPGVGVGLNRGKGRGTGRPWVPAQHPSSCRESTGPHTGSTRLLRGNVPNKCTDKYASDDKNKLKYKNTTMKHSEIQLSLQCNIAGVCTRGSSESTSMSGAQLTNAKSQPINCGIPVASQTLDDSIQWVSVKEVDGTSPRYFDLHLAQLGLW